MSIIKRDIKEKEWTLGHEAKGGRADGQVFSYWQQEKSSKWLAIYASEFDGKDSQAYKIGVKPLRKGDKL